MENATAEFNEYKNVCDEQTQRARNEMHAPIVSMPKREVIEKQRNALMDFIEGWAKELPIDEKQKAITLSLDYGLDPRLNHLVLIGGKTKSVYITVKGQDFIRVNRPDLRQFGLRTEPCTSEERKLFTHPQRGEPAFAVKATVYYQGCIFSEEYGLVYQDELIAKYSSGAPTPTNTHPAQMAITRARGRALKTFVSPQSHLLATMGIYDPAAGIIDDGNYGPENAKNITPEKEETQELPPLDVRFENAIRLCQTAIEEAGIDFPDFQSYKYAVIDFVGKTDEKMISKIENQPERFINGFINWYEKNKKEVADLANQLPE